MHFIQKNNKNPHFIYRLTETTVDYTIVSYGKKNEFVNFYNKFKNSLKKIHQLTEPVVNSSSIRCLQREYAFRRSDIVRVGNLDIGRAAK